MKKMSLCILLFVSMNLFAQQTVEEQQKHIKDSLTLLLQNAPHDSLRYSYAYELSRNLLVYDSKGAKKMMGIALEVALKNKWKGKIVRAYNGMANCSAAGGDVETAITFRKKSLSFSVSDKEIAVAYYGLASDYLRLSDYTQTLDNAYKGLPYAEKSGFEKVKYSTYGIIGDVFMRTGKLGQALDIRKKELLGANVNNDVPAVCSIYGGIGLIYDNMGEADSAMKYYELQLKLAKELGNKRTESSGLGNIANLYIQKKDFKKALACALESLALQKETGGKLGQTSNLLNIGSIYLELGNLVLAEKYSLKALDLSREIKAPDNEAVVLEVLSSIYEKKGDYKKALGFYKKQVSVRDTIFNQQKQEDLTRQELTYEFGKKTATDSTKAAEEKKILAQQNRLQELQLSRSRYTVYGLGAFCILALFIAYLLIRQNKLRAGQVAMQLEQKLLRLQMNPHFIFNCLQAIQNFIEDRQAIKYLSSFGALTRSVLESSRMESIPLNKEVALLKHYLELQKLLHEQQFTYSIDIDPEVDMENIHIPPMLAQPFIENAIEHGMRDIQSGGHIEIRFTADDNFLFLEICDNGSGVRIEKYKQYRSLATTITRERLSLLNKKNKKKASFSVSESFPDRVMRGVKVNFNIPV